MFNDMIKQLNVRTSVIGGLAGGTGAFFVASTALVLGDSEGSKSPGRHQLRCW